MARGKRLGELLVEKGAIKPWQLELALEEQKRSNDFLGMILLRKGWLKEEALVEALADQFGIAYQQIDTAHLDPAAAKLLSSVLCREHTCVPIAMDPTSVTVAIANPLDAWAISEVERAAGYRRVRLVLAPSQQIRAAIIRLYQQAVQSLGNQERKGPDDHV